MVMPMSRIDELEENHQNLQNAWMAARQEGEYDLANELVGQLARSQREIDAAKRNQPIHRDPTDWYLE